jgi:ferrous iron transport protein A
MIPLTVADAGQDYVVKRIGGNPEVKKHLEDLGFVAGADVSVVNTMGGNLIVKVKESRVAISKEMAMKIMI